MAAATIARIMPVWQLWLVAALAVGFSGMVKFNSLPGCDRMATIALPIIMTSLHFICVAVLAILIMGVIKRNICPANRAVAAETSPFIVELRLFCFMARQTICHARVVYCDNGPILYIGVALGAGARKVLIWRFFLMAGFTFCDVGMIIGEL